MNNNQMRAWVRDAYPGPKWKNRVDTMPDEQVLAIFKRLQANNHKPKKG